eukprot:TRINITY_DN29194_c0_g1_i1.p1 TRINITY_DN29194_c0_g1~~TRINITY_DN29194_c0_g1_i1.p1  ORF type:complete len:551 (+),score=157.37 TRINITY_DN29194_c0_g1_i1:45-1655(+)
MAAGAPAAEGHGEWPVKVAELAEQPATRPPPPLKSSPPPSDVRFRFVVSGDDAGLEAVRKLADATAAPADALRLRAQIQAGWGRASAEEFVAARTVADSFSLVEHWDVPFLTRSSLKLLEMDQSCGGITAPGLLPEEKGVLHFLDLCGAPGGWTEYLLWSTHTKNYHPRAVWTSEDAAADAARAGPRPSSCRGWGMSLVAKKSGGAIYGRGASRLESLGWQEDQFHPTARMRLNPDFRFWGEDGTGDATNQHNLSALAEHVRAETQGRGVALFMADGGHMREENDWARQEEGTQRLLLCEVLCMLLTVRKGGNCVLKLVDCASAMTAQLLWIIRNEYSEVRLAKPHTSRAANAERYVVGMGRLREPSWGGCLHPVPAGADTARAIRRLQSRSRQGQAPGLDSLCRGLRLANEAMKASEKLLGVIDPEQVLSDRGFVEWLREQNTQHIGLQIKACRLLTAVLARGVDHPEVSPVAAVRGTLRSRWWSVHGVERVLREVRGRQRERDEDQPAVMDAKRCKQEAVSLVATASGQLSVDK